MPSILFASMYNLLDETSGAAISSRETLLALSRVGWRVHVLCGSWFDSYSDVQSSINKATARLKNPQYSTGEIGNESGDSLQFQLIQSDDRGIDFKFFVPYFPDTSRSTLDPNVGFAFLKLLTAELASTPPDVFATYGGYWATRIAVSHAKKAGARTVFHLHNLGYDRHELFQPFDAVVVPSEFARDFYRNRLQIETEVIPPIIDMKGTAKPESPRRFVTFINPSPEKGLYFWAGIAKELYDRRPDVQLLVVGSRTKADMLTKIPALRNINFLYVDSTTELHKIYAQTRILLVPSLCQETFGRVVVEAAFNHIPVLRSDRGALSDVLPDNRETVLHIPEKFNADTTSPPIEAEITPWLEVILRLWDNEDYRRQIATRTAAESLNLYHFDKISDQTVRFYNSLIDPVQQIPR